MELPTDAPYTEVLLDNYVVRHRIAHAGVNAPVYSWEARDGWTEVVTNLDHPYVASWPADERGRLYLHNLTEALVQMVASRGIAAKTVDRAIALKDILLQEFAVEFGLARPTTPPADPPTTRWAKGDPTRPRVKNPKRPRRR